MDDLSARGANKRPGACLCSIKPTKPGEGLNKHGWTCSRQQAQEASSEMVNNVRRSGAQERYFSLERNGGK